jgi:hypothetical protein
MTSSATDSPKLGTAAALLVGALLAPLAAQDEPRLHVAFGARPARLTVPAIEWLCHDHLPKRPEWPTSLAADEAFALTLSPRGIVVSATPVTLPADVVAAGSCSIGAGRPMVFRCGTDGTEDWYVPLDFALPDAWRTMLRALQADLLDEPRLLDATVVVGHLAGAMVDGDPRGELLRLGSSLCGQVAWTTWTTPTHVRVRGKSDGGLSLPAVFLALAAGAHPAPETALALRAFAGRDGDRAEAARQLARTPGERATATLRALLHADDTTALAAIDTLVRSGCTDELPRIVAAAKPQSPWASLAAADALRELWVFADPVVRARTRKAVAGSQSMAVRQVDLDRLPTRVATPSTAAAPDDGAGRLRALLLLGIFAVGLHGLWARERARLRLPSD